MLEYSVLNVVMFGQEKTMIHDESKWGKSYDPNCMCERCHSIWELLVMAGDSVTINGWIDDMNEMSNDPR